MKQMRFWWFFLLFLYSLLAVSPVEAQSNLCRNAFSCQKATQSSVVINPVGAGAWSQLYNTNGFTWEAWFRLRSAVVPQSVIISVEDAVPFQDIFLGFGWGSNPTALDFHITDDGTNNTVVDAQYTPPLTVGTWYHVAGVCDYAAGELRLYLNGALVTTQAIPANVLLHRINLNHSAFIGNASASLSGSDIDVDETRFWSSARTQTEIQQNMTACLSLPQTGLVAWFKADEGYPVSKSAVDANFTATLQNAGYTSPAPTDNCYTLSIGETPTSCKTIDFTGLVSSGITILTWTWGFGDGNTSAVQNPSHTYNSSGLEHITLDVKDNAGCGANVATDITVIATPITDAQTISICDGQSFLGHTTSGIFVETIAAPTGCDTIRTYTLNVNVKPDLGADKSAAVCDGGAADITGLYNIAGYSSANWNVANPSAVGAGVYTLIVAEGSCKDTANIVVSQKLSTNTTVDTSFCEGGAYQGYVRTGDYIDIFNGSNGCDSIRTLHLQVYPVYNTVIDTVLCNGGSIEGYTEPGSYTDIFHSVNGCDSVRLLNITPCDIFFPNAFSPNKDGKNDVFKALNAANLTVYRLIVCNRWGQVIFESRNPAAGWDGNYNGKAADPGAYIYYCEYIKRGASQPGKLKGALVLIR